MNVNDYKELYRSEAEDSLQALENGLIGLETAVEPRAQVDELFRHAHNLKGTSGAMGYERVVEVSHALENVLDGVRRGGDITPHKVDALLRSVDSLKKLVQCALAESGDAGNVDPIVHEALDLLSTLLDRDQGADAPPRSSSEAETGGNSDERSHEALSQRITSTRVELERLDRLMDLVGELTISRIRFSAIAGEIGSKALLDELATSWRLVSQIQKEVMEARLIPVGQVFQRFNRLVRDLSREMGKKVRFEVAGAEIGLDRTVLENMVDPLMHLIRNALDHGIETPTERGSLGKPEEARLTLSARREGNTVVLEVSDDGRGIDFDRVAERAAAIGLIKTATMHLTDEDVCRILTTPGFSTSDKVDHLSGRGMGMNIVKKTVDTFGGSTRIRSGSGNGTVVSLVLPINLSIIKALLFSVGTDVHAIPIEYVRETSRFEHGALKTVNGAPVLTYEDRVVPVLMPADILGIPFEMEGERYARVIVMDTGQRRVAVVVNRIIGHQDIVIKALPPLFRGLRGISGATILGSGKVAFIWDPHILFEGRCTYESDQEALVLEN